MDSFLVGAEFQASWAVIILGPRGLRVRILMSKPGNRTGFS